MRKWMIALLLRGPKTSCDTFEPLDDSELSEVDDLSHLTTTIEEPYVYRLYNIIRLPHLHYLIESRLETAS
jgi:hypothetical protein